MSFQGGGARGTRPRRRSRTGGRPRRVAVRGRTTGRGAAVPLWGRGLVLGGAAEPWARAPEDRGQRARFRGRSGGGVLFDSRPLGLAGGRFAKRDLAGMRVGAGPVSLGTPASRGGAPVEPGIRGRPASRRVGRRRARPLAPPRPACARLRESHGCRCAAAQPGFRLAGASRAQRPWRGRSPHRPRAIRVRLA